MGIAPYGKWCNLLHYYNTGDDQDLAFGWNVTLAETFTLTQPTLIAMASCLIKWPSGTRTLACFIRDTDATGKPTGIPFAMGLATHWLTAYDNNPFWVNFGFRTWPVLPAGQYAIEVYSGLVTDFLAYRWRVDTTLPTHPVEKAWRSLDGGATWAELVDWDFMYEIWGWVPPPDPPPEPVPDNWAPVDYSHTDLLDGFTVVVETDIECHLWKRETSVEPLHHPSQEFRRGIRLMSGIRWCFVAWNEVEQEEAGDTFTHTFIQHNWPVCETRWFYFIGSKQRQESPSASPIFHLHREAEYTPLTYGPVPASQSNRTLWRTWGSWVVVHDSPWGTIGPWHDLPSAIIVADTTLTASYFLYRGFLRFDTSGIPPGSLIIAVTLSLYMLGKTKTSSVAHPYIQVTQGQQSTIIVPTNYGDQLPWTFVGGQIDIDDIIPGQYNHIHFNPLGLTFLNLGGMTRFCIRAQMDVLDWRPRLGTNNAWFHSAQKGPGYWPELTVYYVPP